MTKIRSFRTIAFTLLAGVYVAALPAGAQTTIPAPVIDGKLDDVLWQHVAARRLEPAQAGVSADLGGDIRVIVRGHHLLIAARLPEPTGRVAARVTGRHPDWEDEDILQITAGPDIGYTDRVIRINPFGAFTTEREGQEVYANADRYLIATAVHDREWIVEAAIPLNEMSTPGPEPVLWSAQRIRAMRPGSPQQRWRWPHLDASTKAAVDRSAPWDAPAPVYLPAPLGNQESPLEAGRMAIPPLDAGWDDPQWAQVPEWRLKRNEPGALPAQQPTLVKVAHDGKTLAILARCAEPGELIASVKEHDGPVERDDSFHVYLGVSGSSYAQIATNALGYMVDLTGKTGGPRISRPRADWESDAQVSVGRGQGFWTARMDLPLAKVLNILGEAESQSELRVLFARVRPGRNGETSETSALPTVSGQTLTGSIRYRRLRLSANAPQSLPAAEIPAAPPALDTRVWNTEERKTRKAVGMLHNQIRARVQKALESEAQSWSAVRTRQDWEQFRSKRLQALSKVIGEFPARVPLNVTVGKSYRGEGYRRLDLIYRSRADLWVAANLYLPARTQGRVPAIIVIPSHHRPRMQSELQDMGILWARQGSAVLIADNIGHGERIQTYPWNREGYHSRYNMGLQLYVAGESLIKWMVWDTMRAVDLLVERSEVDPRKIILLGAVAAGGDPAAITAALDPRIAAVAPFNYGEATPEHGGRASWPAHLADPGWGSWETSRYLPRSVADQFLPWLICASVAPRRFVLAYEMGWDVEKQPVWLRYRKVFGLYDAQDNLDEAHGFGGFPGTGECANIGPSQRKTLYPELQRWFGIAPPAQEPDDRRPEAELLAYSPELATKAPSRPVHELAREIGRKRLEAARAALSRLDAKGRIAWLRREWTQRLGDVEPNRSPRASAPRMQQLDGIEAQAITLDVEPGIAVPLLFLKPSSNAAKRGVVVALSHAGKAGLWHEHHAEITTLLRNGIAVCLPDLRGTGETAPDMRRGPSSTEVTEGATELMLGNSLLGGRLKDVRTVLAYLRNRPDVDGTRIALWGDSEAAVNPQRLLLDESPGWQIGPDIQYESDPLGGLLAVFAALYEDNLRGIATRRSLISFESILDDPFAYVPGHVIVPDMLSAGDLSDIAASLPAASILFESPIDARNRVIPQAGSQSRPSLASWLAARLQATP
jgi:cephalosporin-C deacetylase-like acetyl esterase